MQLLRFAAEGLPKMSPDASQMPPQPQAPKWLLNGSQNASQMAPKWLLNESMNQ